jgi:kumamolisin
MSARRLALGGALVAAIATVVLIAFVFAAGSTPAPGGASVLGRTDPHRRLGISLILKLQHQDALDRFLSASRDPRSPDYGQTLKPRQFGARFGLSLQRLRSLRSVLVAHGLDVLAEYPQRTSLRVVGTTGSLDSIFSTQLQDRVDSRGQRYVAPNVPPRLPPWLGSDVVGVTGLNTRPVMTPADVPAGGLTPSTVTTAYDLAPLRSAGIDGSGQTVAVVSFDSFQQSDLANYEAHFGIQGPPVRQVSVAGGTVPGGGQSEVDLDLDTIRGIAPGAQVLSYEAPRTGASDADVINQIVADGRANVISTSWGRCDALVPGPARVATENALAAARAAGITVFAASGDNGAYDCQSANLDDLRPTVDYPAASDNVVAVGGTRVALRQDGTYLAEYGWEDVLSGQGSGGGLASVTPRPPWQQGPQVLNSFSDGHRQVPDVSGPADPDSGMNVVVDGRLREVGGSIVSPDARIRRPPGGPRSGVHRAAAVPRRRQPLDCRCAAGAHPRRQPQVLDVIGLELRHGAGIAGRRGAGPGAGRHRGAPMSPSESDQHAQQVGRDEYLP